MKELNKIHDYNFFKYCVSTLFLFLFVSCEAGFNNANTNETDLTSIDPLLELNYAIINSDLGFAQLHCETAIVKQQARVFAGQTCAFNGDVGTSANEYNFNHYYGEVINNLLSAVHNSSTDSNLHNIARIWKAYAFMIVTDSYGAVPYTEAGKGYLEDNAFPDYNAQKFIYTSDEGILEELASASAALAPGKSENFNEVLYGGDIVKWKRLGYSLLLRAAMRLTKVNPDIAEKYVKIAMQGGLMQSTDDNAIIQHTANYPNNPGKSLNGGQSHYQYLIRDFVNYFKDNNDPRLASIAVRYPGATSANGQAEATANRDPEDQIGFPMGYDQNSVGPIVEEDGLSSFYAYSQADRKRIMDPTAPAFLATYALQELLLAEAAYRGWIHGDPEALYENGIEAHMHQFKRYNNATIPQDEIDAYIEAHPLETGDELEQINTQYWVASYLIPPETWANFRRSGYPDLEPNPLRGDLGPDEAFIRRFTYPDEEKIVNENIENATSPDQLGTRVWWDIKQ